MPMDVSRASEKFARPLAFWIVAPFNWTPEISRLGVLADAPTMSSNTSAPVAGVEAAASKVAVPPSLNDRLGVPFAVFNVTPSFKLSVI
jgi:hypothetical protein